MEQVTMTIDTMDDVRREIDNCQRKAMTSVVELGYILRKADDAGIYKEQGYTSIFTFAKEEYGWSQSQTSRFMDINREFSEGGYSAILKEQYKGFGQAKLAEMLTLPENIREELNPDMKRDEIREVKSQFREAGQEEKENTFEAAVFSGGQEDGMQVAVEKLFSLPDMAKKLPGLYPYMKRTAEGGEIPEEDIRMAISSTGFGTIRAGGMMFFWKKDGVTTIRGQQKKAFSYKELLEMANRLENPEGKTLEEWYRNVYGKDLTETPKKTETAHPEQESARGGKPEYPHSDKTKEKKPGTKTTPGIETPANSGESDHEERTELNGRTEISEFTDRMAVGQSQEDTKPEHPETERTEAGREDLEPVSGIETSTNIGKSYKAETEYAEVRRDTGGCCYCCGMEKIKSNDGQFQIHLHKNGLARIEYQSVSAIMEYSFCLVCGKELGGSEK